MTSALSNLFRYAYHTSFEIASVLSITNAQPLMLIKLTCISQIQASLGTHLKLLKPTKIYGEHVSFHHSATLQSGFFLTSPTFFVKTFRKVGDSHPFCNEKQLPKKSKFLSTVPMLLTYLRGYILREFKFIHNLYKHRFRRPCYIFKYILCYK